jgi:hypothetical protein
MLALRLTKDAHAMHEVSTDSQSERAAVSALLEEIKQLREKSVKAR